jgi:hypothetical protein
VRRLPGADTCVKDRRGALDERRRSSRGDRDRPALTFLPRSAQEGRRGLQPHAKRHESPTPCAEPILSRIDRSPRVARVGLTDQQSSADVADGSTPPNRETRRALTARSGLGPLCAAFPSRRGTESRQGSTLSYRE